MRALVLGLGEAGSIYARGLRDAGYEVVGFDPFTTLSETGVRQETDLAAATAGVDLTLSIVGARAAQAVADSAMPLLHAGSIYADLNTGSPELKAEIAALAEKTGVLFADVAVLAPVPRAGVRTPLLASGTGATALGEALAAASVPIEVISERAGDAAARKLLRSVFMKGLAGVILEAVGAAEKVGADGWLRDQIAAEFSGDSPALIQRLLDGSRVHAARRAHEVEDARDFLESLDQPSFVTQAARQWYDVFLADSAERGVSKADVTEASVVPLNPDAE
ncbi:DUF1932 domain-containing protein [Leucobacter sp. W1478]|uniref:DUF1932 domain-containing protein n=1 Tax=Leucobacter sp. W1478 TaxID=3439065 RepID=UPI003F37F7B5